MKIVLTVFCFFILINKAVTQNIYDTYYKGYSSFINEDYSSAIEYFTTSITQNTVDYQDYLYRGKSYLNTNQFSKAITDFKMAENLKTGCANYYIAECYASLKKQDSSVFYLKENLSSNFKTTKSEILTDIFFDGIENTEEWINFLKEDNFSSQDLLLNDAEYALKKERYIEALDIVNQIINKNKRKHQAIALKGEIYCAMSDYKSAAECFEKAIEIIKNTDYIESLALCYSKLEKYNKAILQYNYLIEKNPKNINLFYLRALNYNELKEYSNALSDIELYLTYFLNDTEAKKKYAEIQINSENYIEATKILNNLIELKPYDSEYYYLRGKSYLNSYSYKLAIDDFSYSLDLNQCQTDIYMLRAQAKLNSEDIEGACNDWKKSVENGDYHANNYLLKYCKN